jgi:hypothetical protein
MTFPKCEDGYNKRKLTDFAKGVVDDFKNIPMLMKLKPSFPRYVLPGWYIADNADVQTDAGIIYYIPIFVSERTTYTAMAMTVSRGSSGIADLRIYSWDNGVPGSLILSAGTVDTSEAGIKEIPINLTLNRGYYFIAVRLTGTPVVFGPNLNSPVVPPVPGFETAFSGNAPLVILVADGDYSDPAPTPTDALEASYAFVYLKE